MPEHFPDRKSFTRDSCGAISVLLVVLLPFLIVLGGIAVDVAQINAQKRATQAEADLAALSAATLLPDRVAARARVEAMLSALTPCRVGGDCQPDPEITFLARNDEGLLIESADPTAAAVALRVENRHPYTPVLLGRMQGPKGAPLVIARSALAERASSAPGHATFTLRNQLLSLNTRDSILDHILSPLGVSLTVDALGSGGLANARVKLDRLLKLASLGLAVELATFNDLLQVPISLRDLLGVALHDPFGTPWGGVNTRVAALDKTVTLAEILQMSPQLLNLKAGDVLPDIEIGALDLLKLAANLAAAETQRLSLGLDLTLIDSRLGGASVGLGLIRSHATGHAVAADQPMPHAVLRQTDLSVQVGLLSLVRLDLVLGIAGIEAELVSLNCKAQAGTDEILAEFDVRTYPLSAFLSIQLLNKDASLDAHIAPEDSASRLLADPDSHRVSFTRDQYDAGQRSQDVQGRISISNLGEQLQTLLQNIEIGPAAGSGSGCKGSILGCILDALTGLTAKLVGLVLDVVSLVIPLDLVVNSLLQALGLNVAGGTITLEHVDCSGENVGPARLAG